MYHDYVVQGLAEYLKLSITSDALRCLVIEHYDTTCAEEWHEQMEIIVAINTFACDTHNITCEQPVV